MGFALGILVTWETTVLLGETILIFLFYLLSLQESTGPCNNTPTWHVNSLVITPMAPVRNQCLSFDSNVIIDVRYYSNCRFVKPWYFPFHLCVSHLMIIHLNMFGFRIALDVFHEPYTNLVVYQYLLGPIWDCTANQGHLLAFLVVLKLPLQSHLLLVINSWINDISRGLLGLYFY